MVRVLSVAEKNDAAKSLANVLSNGRCSKREGFSRFNKIYEFECKMMNQQVKMSMTSVSGHLLALEFIGMFKKWNSCNPVDLFSVPVQKYCPESYLDIKKTLEKEIKGCKSLIIWTDCDREGENIGYEIIEVCQAVKPDIKIYRAKFSEITPHAVNRAMNNLGPPEPRINDAVNVRTELDLRIGAAFTRFQTLRLKRKFPDALAEQLISYGSCQFPTLGFVVERYKQVQAFIPEPFWKIIVRHESDEVKAEFRWKRNRSFDFHACQVLFDLCIENPVATVIDVKSKNKSKWRPQALDTVELEKNASRKLKINAKETMKIAEKLYTQGFISYPRTETNMFAKEIDLVALVEEQTRDPQWGDFAQQVLENGPNPRNGSKTDNAHPPIHPLKYTDSLNGDEAKVYEFVVRHFLACVSQDAQGHETVVQIDISQEQFMAQGLMILARNYLDVYPYERWNAKEIPLYYEGDQFEPHSIELESGETTAPSLLTEADLIALMEKHGIGTDATHADHIETVKSRMYVGLRQDGKFVPGQLGMGLVEGYDDMGFEMSKPHLRAGLEKDLQLICEGRKSKEDVLQVQVQNYKDVFIEACRQAQKLDQALSNYLGEAQATIDNEEMSTASSSIVMKCPRCGQPMTLNSRKEGNGFYIGCSQFPDCRASIWFPESQVKNVTLSDQVCPNCNPGPVMKLNFKFKAGSVPMTMPREYEGCVGGCDEMLTEVLGIRPIGRSSSGNNSAPHSRPNTDRGGNSSRGRGVAHGGGGYTAPGIRSLHSASPSFNSNDFSPSIPSVGVVTPISSNRKPAHSAKVPLMSTNRKKDLKKDSILKTGFGSNAGFREFQSDNRADGDDKAIVCNCGNDALQLTVRKEGPNTGRQFYKCSGRNDTDCNFFLWADQEPPPASSQESNRRNTSTTNTTFHKFRNNSDSRSGMSDDVLCKCGQIAKKLTVQKEGPNTGRQFFACSKPRDQSCNFFQWDEAGTNGNMAVQNHGRNQQHNQTLSWGGSNSPFLPKPNSSKRKRPSSMGEDGSKQRRAPPTCGLCGQKGHRRPSCPQKNDF